VLLEALFIPVLLFMMDSVPCYAMLQRTSESPNHAAWFHIALSLVLF